jgi:CheY-like chemotaxis protein
LSVKSSSPEPEQLSVVFIEDDPAIAQMYRFKLEHDGYAVTVAADGVAGLEAVRRVLPDLVFLDIRLPKMDGFAVLEQLRADPLTGDIPVVILSNYSEKEMIDRGMSLGALEYVIKSEVTPAKVSDRVPTWATTATP